MSYDNKLLGLISTFHFYASMILGIKFYEVFVLPSCPISFTEVAATTEALRMALPLYALNAMAFGSLIYLSTRPLVLLAEHLMQKVFQMFEGQGRRAGLNS